MDKSYIIIRVDGVVQGVGFRAATRAQARSIGLTGYVHNLPDGQVEIVAGGLDEQKQRLIDWLKAGGPQLAKITNLTLHPYAPNESITTFTIK